MKKQFCVRLSSQLVQQMRMRGISNLSGKIEELMWQYLYSNPQKTKLSPLQTSSLQETLNAVNRIAKEKGYEAALICAEIHCKDVLPRYGIFLNVLKIMELANESETLTVKK